MSKIIRTPTSAKGGITTAEKAQMAQVAEKWIDIAMQTGPCNREKAAKGIRGIYAAAKLKEPRVVFVPSPLVMALAYGASAAIWHARKTCSATSTATAAATAAATRDATEAATNAATKAATRDATYSAIRAVTDDATHAATRAATFAATAAATNAATDAATYDATDTATYAATYFAIRAATSQDHKTNNPKILEAQAAKACFELAGPLGLACAKRWSSVYQGGNMWAGWCSYLSAARDVLGLQLPSHEAYAPYEQAAMHSGFRVMHEEFCIVSDFPTILKKDEANRPHCENGPSHQWADGWALYHWHGVGIPSEWIEDKDRLTASTALNWTNVEQRRAACEIIGWAKVLKELNARVIDEDDDPEIGTLLEVDLPDSDKERFIQVRCGTGRIFALPVPSTIKTALEGNAWTYGFDNLDFIKPEVRT